MNELRQQAATVAKLRRAAAEAKAQLDASRQAWESANHLLIVQEALCRQELADNEGLLRLLAVEHYEANPTSKQLPFGIGIRMVKRIAYHAEDALGWAIKHGVALKLDKPVFDDLARTQPAMFPFVQVVEDTTATLPPSLDGALEVQP